MPESLIEIRHVTRKFAESTALKNVSFDVHKGEILTVVGPSGCGKSTMARLLAGLDRPTSGEILVEGDPVTGPSPDRGMVFQKYTLFPWLTVVKNVMFALTMQGQGRRTAESEALQWVDMIGLADFAHRYPHELSGGMQQRVAIARSLAARPKVLLMDEPFGALDAQTRTKMQRHLLEICDNIDITVVFITHDLDEAIFLADRVLVLKPNPGEVNAMLEVPIPRPRGPDALTTEIFADLRSKVDEMIHQTEEEVEDLPMHLFTMKQLST